MSLQASLHSTPQDTWIGAQLYGLCEDDEVGEVEVVVADDNGSTSAMSTMVGTCTQTCTHAHTCTAHTCTHAHTHTCTGGLDQLACHVGQ